jgi:hypothetical protein
MTSGFGGLDLCVEQESGQQLWVVAGHHLLHLGREEGSLHGAERSPLARLAGQEPGIPQHLQEG